MKNRPPIGHTFEAVRLVPEGWVVLTPWITTPDGHWWRLHLSSPGHDKEAEQWARHMASQLNKGGDDE